nr:MAG TPA: hypothetical protein [Caudoviricetes sp.]
MIFLLVRQMQQMLLQILMTMSKSLLLSVTLSFLLLSRRQSVLPLNVLLHQVIAAAVATMAVVVEEPLLLVLALLLQLFTLLATLDLRARAFVLPGFLTSSLTQALVPSTVTHVICTTPGATLPIRALLNQV